MRLLIADDEPLSRRVLHTGLSAAGYDVVTAEDGATAWDKLQSPDAPKLAVLDWMMPKVDGIEVCRRLRQSETSRYTYVILLTAREHKGDLRIGLDAGADDYITKPYDGEELLSRVRAGERILNLHALLQEHVAQLQEALAHVKKLQGLLPICMHCKCVRDDQNSWHRIETYIEQHSEAMFTHALCQECMKEHYPEYADADPARHLDGADPT